MVRESGDDTPSPGRVELRWIGAVATIKLDRPDRQNALDQPMWEALAAAFEEIARNEDGVRCVVLTGEGGRFTPGADIREFETHRANADGARAYGVLMDRTYESIRRCPAPVIAAIDGPCTGAGLVLALLCDLRIATRRSVFGAPVSRLGLAMPYPEFAVLWQSAGPAKTLELLLEARIIDAEEAAALTLINRVADDDRLDAAVQESVDRITAGAPLVHRWHKAFSQRLSRGGALSDDEIAASYESFSTEDYREGYRAFLQKRRPSFEGR